ncbi:MAG: GxxExxY protein [Opitutus sp.]
MKTDEHRSDLVAGEVTHVIVGACFEVLNGLGHGLHEKPYENALVVELGLKNIQVQQQRSFEVVYKSVRVSEFIPDLMVGGSVIVDVKVIERITDFERGLMLNYLRITKRRVGLIVNFRKPKLKWERVIL